MQPADLFEREPVFILARLIRPGPRLFIAAPKEAEVFKLFAVRIGIEYPDPRAANFNGAIKCDDCVDDCAEVVGQVVGFCLGVCFAVCRFVNVADVLFEFVILGIDTLHRLHRAAFAVGVIFKRERFILPFEFFNAVYVRKVFECHLLPLSCGLTPPQVGDFDLIFER